VAVEVESGEGAGGGGEEEWGERVRRGRGVRV
jgi:hypothetical protein